MGCLHTASLRGFPFGETALDRSRVDGIGVHDLSLALSIPAVSELDRAAAAGRHCGSRRDIPASQFQGTSRMAQRRSVDRPETALSGWSHTPPGIGRFHVAVVTAVDRQAGEYNEVLERRIEVTRALRSRIAPQSVLCTDVYLG